MFTRYAACFHWHLIGLVGVFLMCFAASGQVQKNPFISLGSAQFIVGTSHGIQPNYRLGEGNFFYHFSMDQDLLLKGVPLKIHARVSDEPYRSGRPSYFRVCYDAYAARNMRLDSLNSRLRKLEQRMSLEQDSIYYYESKLSYLHQMQSDSIHKLELLSSFPSGATLPDVSLDSTLVKLPSVSVPELAASELPSVGLGSLEGKLDKYTTLLQAKELELSTLKSAYSSLQGDYQELTNKNYGSFLEGIHKLDLGLTSLSPGGFSANAVPIQGLQLRGSYHKWHYSLGVGFTMPNQLFSNLAFDQVLTNSSNVFNMSNYFSVNTVRFVSSEVLEYGEKQRNSVYVSDYYTGRSLEQLKAKTGGSVSNTTNVGFYYTPKFARFLTFSGSLGQSQLFSDTVSRSVKEKLGAMGSMTARFERLGSELKLMIKSVGRGYDGFSQGIYLRGFQQREVSYKQQIKRRLVGQLRYSDAVYTSQDTSSQIRTTQQGTLDVQYKIGSQSVVYASGTLLNAQTSTSDLGLSHLLKSGLVLYKPFKSVVWSNNFELGYAHIRGVDSAQLLVQSSWKSSLSFDHWYYSLKGTYQEYHGLTRLYGTNVIVQPEVGIKVGRVSLSVVGQYLQSDQFGEDYGIQLNWSFSPSAFFMWRLSAQRWLASDASFFLTDSSYPYQPWYANFEMVIQLKQQKK